MKISLGQLIEAIKQFPANELKSLQTGINKVVPKKKSKEEFRAFLLQAPVFAKEQIALMEEARKGFNQWGKN